MRNNTHKKHKKIMNHTSKNEKRQKHDTRKNSKKNHRRTQKKGGMIRNFFRTLGLCRPNPDGVIDSICIVDEDKIKRIQGQIKNSSGKDLEEREKDYENIASLLSLDEYNVIIKTWKYGNNNKKIFIKKYVPFLTTKLNRLSIERENIKLSNSVRQKEIVDKIKESNKKRQSFISRPTTSQGISLNNINVDVSKEYSPESFKKEIDDYKKELREHKKIGFALSNNSKKNRKTQEEQNKDDDKMYEDFLKSI